MSAGWWERGEEIFAREDARRAGTLGTCAHHNWRENNRGGLTCVGCGDEVKGDEV